MKLILYKKMGKRCETIYREEIRRFNKIMKKESIVLVTKEMQV